MSEQPTIKDSGNRQKFDTGAVRDSQTGKGRFDLLPAFAIEQLAKHFEAGAAKYDAENWRKGVPLRRYLDSAMRHLNHFLAGKRDEPHAVAALWNIACLIETQEMIRTGLLPKELDNLPCWTANICDECSCPAEAFKPCDEDGNVLPHKCEQADENQSYPQYYQVTAFDGQPWFYRRISSNSPVDFVYASGGKIVTCNISDVYGNDLFGYETDIKAGILKPCDINGKILPHKCEQADENQSYPQYYQPVAFDGRPCFYRRISSNSPVDFVYVSGGKIVTVNIPHIYDNDLFRYETDIKRGSLKPCDINGKILPTYPQYYQSAAFDGQPWFYRRISSNSPVEALYVSGGKTVTVNIPNIYGNDLFRYGTDIKRGSLKPCDINGKILPTYPQYYQSVAFDGQPWFYRRISSNSPVEAVYASGGKIVTCNISDIYGNGNNLFRYEADIKAGILKPCDLNGKIL